MSNSAVTAFCFGNLQKSFAVLHPEHSLGGGVLTLCREAVGVFYSPSRHGGRIDEKKKNYMSTLEDKQWILRIR